MKSINQTSGKGYLEIDFEKGTAILTEIIKDEEYAYNFFEVLENYNDKNINFSIKEENPVKPIED